MIDFKLLIRIDLQRLLSIVRIDLQRLLRIH